jgi:hypothetical protein
VGSKVDAMIIHTQDDIEACVAMGLLEGLDDHDHEPG